MKTLKAVQDLVARRGYLKIQLTNKDPLAIRFDHPGYVEELADINAELATIKDLLEDK